jgi:hypothetical protein
MSAEHEIELEVQPLDEAAEIVVDETEEIVVGVPVLATPRPIEPSRPAALPAAAAAAAAATGFVAGAATLALVRRHGARKAARARLTARRTTNGLPIVGTKSFLVDVHLIARPGD